MAIKTIDSKLFTKMFLAGAANLEANKEIINDLNVFPVPDGDTGTNMNMTILSAVNEINALAELDLDSVSKAISSGSLRGARGNSGVILSQLLRGFTKVLREEQIINVEVIAKACERASATAYKAVMKPKEGTILTVARGIADKALELAEITDDLEVALPEIIAHAEKVLEHTPELLPVLKEAGVVDSGGQGLLEILRGAYAAFEGKEIEFKAIAPKVNVESNLAGVQSLEDIKFCYCTEFLILTEVDFTEKDEDEFKAYLESIGDSIVCVADEDVVKIHVHTNDPGLAIQRALQFGQLSALKIENMREEFLALHGNKEEKKKDEPRKNVGFITVSVGEGMKNIFSEIGVDHVIEGGQTMNPSTEDMLKAIEQVNADHVFIFPNNKNIILAANQAKDLTKDKEIIVIPTTTAPQGISALIGFMETDDIQTNTKNMNEVIQNVKTGQVTYAVRDTQIGGKSIAEGDIMGISDHGISAVGQDIQKTTLELLKDLMDDDAEIISVYYGSDISDEDANSLYEEIEQLYPDVDIDIHSGGQPIYYYILSVE